MAATENKQGFIQLGKDIPSLVLPPFAVGLKWRGADLQTMRNTVLGPALPLDPNYYPVSFDLGQGHSLVGSLHPSENKDILPLVVIIHGLTGSEESPNVISAAAYFYSLGYPVLRLNLRGAGPSAETSFGPYHGGLTEDLEKVINQVVTRHYGAGIILYGISLGGNMMLKYLGEKGDAPEIRAAIAVSAPLCLKSVQMRLMERRNRMYHNYLLLGMKKAARNLAGHYDKSLVEGAQTAATILEFDDRFVAPAYGMSGADEYYERHSSGRFISDIRVPTLLIHAENDPWIPVDSYHQRSWDREGVLSLVISQEGGHAGFHSQDHMVPWHERVGALYMQELLTGGRGPEG